jgi:hypothetical protein
MKHSISMTMHIGLDFFKLLKEIIKFMTPFMIDFVVILDVI